MAQHANVVEKDRPVLIGYCHEMLLAQTVLQITFSDDVLTVINILSFVLQSDYKDFGAVRQTLSSTLTILKKMQNINSVQLKSFQN